MVILSPTSLLGLIYPPPPSIYVTAMSVISAASLINAGFSEIKGTHMLYSKFFNQNNNNKKKKISTKTGMLLLYSPAFIAGLASFAFFHLDHLRFYLLSSALTLHFLKRLLEVLYVHKYSGSMAVEAVIPISLSYFLSTCTMIYAQYLTVGLSEPSLDLKYAGVAIFLAGICGNFYHHCILSKLRKKGDKEYKIPKGGMFHLVICPHYLFEILGFIGASCISQTLYAFSFTVGTTAYLIGRSYATRKWYLSKFQDFPKDIKALIPFIF